MSVRPTRRRLLIVLVGLVIAIAGLVNVEVPAPRVHVRWREGLTTTERRVLEQRFGLGSPEHLEASTWRYNLLDRSSNNIRSMLSDPAVADTAYIDRTSMTVPAPEVQVSLRRYARFLIGPTPWRLLQPQSFCVFASGALLLWTATLSDSRRRRSLALAALLIAAMSAYLVPLWQIVRMGDSATYMASRELFERFAGVRNIRFEAHLSYALLGRLYGLYGDAADAPVRTLATYAHLQTAWFFLSAIAIGTLERWSPHVIRYLGLALLMPATLLFFGYRDLGHLSLNVAAFPLFARGLADRSWRLEAGGALFGLGAAFHGYGLLSLAGAVLAALGVPASALERVRLTFRILSWGVAAYVGWVAIYEIALGISIVPGHAVPIPWRPWLAYSIDSHRVNAAILSALGGRDLFFTAWVVGAPLFAVMSTIRGHRDELRTALLYALPSVIFSIMCWPVQGIGVDTDIVFGAFPAVYALMWLCAHDERRSLIAAAILASAHLAFWRMVIGTDFVNSPI